jgi:hypothetical protein
MTITYCKELNIYRLRNNGKEVTVTHERLENAGIARALLEFAQTNYNCEIEVKD